MTTTDIGILLIVLCVLLWAIMAALHRHTVQLNALKAQLQELLAAQHTRSSNAGQGSRAPAQNHDIETLAAHTPSDRAEPKAQRTMPK